MIEILHNEARKLLIEALEKKHKVQEIADCYSVNRSTVYRLKKRWEETGSFETRTFLRGRKPALSPEKLASIDQLSLYIANDHAPTANSQIHPSTVSRHVSKIASIQFKLIHPHSKYPCRYHFLGRFFR